MKPSPRILFASIAFVLLILFLNTCGIEQFIQLNPPSDPGTLAETFTFTKTTYNSEPEFRGFDLYYRMYGTEDDPYPDLDSIIEFEDLGANGFRRIHASDDREGQIQRPLIRIQQNDRTEPPPPTTSNDVFSLTVDFTYIYDIGVPTELLGKGLYPKIIDDGDDIDDKGLIDSPDDDLLELSDPPPILINITDIRRDVYDSSDGSYKRFSEFSEGDTDITGEIWDDIELGLAVKIYIYAISYGYDFGNFRSLYSEPVRLGVIERVFPHI